MAVVLRGVCDYVDSHAAQGYPEVFAGGPVINVPGAGHALLEDRPDVVTAVVRGLLAAPTPGVTSRVSEGRRRGGCVALCRG